MIVYRFMPANYGLISITERRLKISKIDELNDSFELLSVNLSNRDYRSAHEEVKKHFAKNRGLLCFSKYWNNSLMWGHYAEKHKGVCLGFEIPSNYLLPVTYIKSRLTHTFEPDESYIRKILTNKAEEWSYEREYRLFTDLKDQIDGIYYYDFSEHGLAG